MLTNSARTPRPHHRHHHRFFVSNISKDGVGGVSSCGQGSLWRVDALRGMAANGSQKIATELNTTDNDDLIGHDCGFRAEVLIEDTHTSLEFFKVQWRSAYVCEAGETLAVCVEQPNTVAWRVKQVRSRASVSVSCRAGAVLAWVLFCASISLAVWECSFDQYLPR